jgi:hypothetical protein
MDAGEPILTALIVDPDTGRCSPGFEKEFHRDDEQERWDCYEFWAPRGEEAVPPHGGGETEPLGEETLRSRAVEFAMAPRRPQQAQFRRRVFLACGGACVVTGCTIVEALDAAHRHGRDWRQHNKGSDGLLLRKDIHALYDANLVRIGDDGRVEFAESALAHYRDWLEARK